MPVLARPGWDADASGVLNVPEAREIDGEGQGRGQDCGRGEGRRRMGMQRGPKSLLESHISRFHTQPVPIISMSATMTRILTFLKRNYLHPYHFRGLSFLILTHLS